MPSKDYTPELFDLKGAIIKNIYHTTTEIHIHFSMEKRPYTCPKCGDVTESVHDYRDSVIRDIPISGKHTILHYRKRRYRCSCCNKRFYEDFPFYGKYFRTTLRLAFYSLAILRETLSISSTARLLKLSPSFIFRRMKDIDHSKPKSLPEVLSIDEFRGNCGGQKFQAIFTDN